MKLDDNARLWRELARRYRADGAPVEVRFRDLVRDVPLPERATHLLHPYPAKLLAHIPIFFLRDQQFSERGETILDPFCGSGTVLVEAVIAGRKAVGVDTNPHARLVASTKVESYEAAALRRAASALLKRVKLEANFAPPDVVNIDHWFSKDVQRQLAALVDAIGKTRNRAYQQFFEVCLSAVVRKVSWADPRLSVPVRLRETTYPSDHWAHGRMRERLRRLERIDVVSEFAATVSQNLDRVAELARLRDPRGHAVVVDGDARSLSPGIEDASISLVLTSPPYPGAQKYVRASSLSIGWLGLGEGKTLRELEDLNIGREHYPVREYDELRSTGLPEADAVCARIRKVSPLRAHIAAQYLIEMRDAVSAISRVLREGGHVVIVAGANRIGGEVFDSPSYLRRMFEEHGLRTVVELCDAIQSRGLMTRRNQTASMISQEIVSVLIR